MQRRFQLLDRQSRPVSLDAGRARLTAAIHLWRGLPILVDAFNGSGFNSELVLPFPTVAVCIGGRSGHMEARAAGQLVRMPFRAGACALHEQGLPIHETTWHGEHAAMVAVQAPADIVATWAPDDESLLLRTAIAVEDATLVALIGEMHQELQRDCASGRLFAEGLSMALLGYLRSRYGHSEEAGNSCRLRRCDLARVLEFIDANLTGDIGIAQLARLVHRSPAHFSRVFKATTGVSPYRYVLRARIERALQLMRGPVPLAEIAQAVGLSNQSHFTKVFRQHVGSTPALVRSEMRKTARR